MWDRKKARRIQDLVSGLGRFKPPQNARPRVIVTSSVWAAYIYDKAGWAGWKHVHRVHGTTGISLRDW